jgi:WD40 repeat protein
MAAEFSADGRRLVPASTDGTARVWDVRTGAASLPPLRHGAAVYRAVFSADGTYVATASAAGTARVWSAGSGQLVMTVPHDEAVTQVSFSRDAREIITASVDGTAIRWHVPGGTGIGFPLTPVGTAVFSPDDRRILTSGYDGFARVWDRTTHRLLASVSHERGQFAVWSGDGARFATAGNDNTARIWLTDGLQGTAPIVLRHDHVVSDAAFQPAGPLIATGSADGRVHLWSSITGRAMGTTLQHVGPIRSVRFDAAGRYLLTAGRDGTARVWDLARRENARIISSTCAEALTIRFSDDGQRIASGGICARLWDERTGEALTPPLGRSQSRVLVRSPQQFSRDLSRVIGLEQDGAQVWNVPTAQPIGRPLAADQSVTVVAMSPGGDVAVTGTGSQVWFGLPARRPTAAGDAQLWNVDTGSPIGQKMPHDETVVVAIFSPDGRRVATATAKGAVRLWDSPTGRPLTAKLMTPATGSGLVALAFSADSELLATGSDDGSVRLWSAANGRLINTFTQHTSVIRALAFRNDGDQLLSASFDGTVRVWDLRRGAQYGPPLQHFGNLSSVTFSPDGRWVLTGGADGTSRVWDARTGIPITPALPHQWRVADVAFAPDGRRFATASSDIRIRPLLPDDRPFEQLESLARLLAGFHVEGMVPVPLKGAELVQEWRRYGAGAATASSR